MAKSPHTSARSAHLARPRLAAAPGPGYFNSRTIRGSSRSCATGSGSISTADARHRALGFDEKSPSRRSYAHSPACLEEGTARPMTHDTSARHHHAVRRAQVLDARLGRTWPAMATVHPFLNPSRHCAGRPPRPSLSSTTTPPTSTEGPLMARPPSRWTFHFVPTSCSWLIAVEGFFAKSPCGRLGAASSAPSFDPRPPSTASSTSTKQNPAPSPDRRSRHHIAAVIRGHQVSDFIH